MLAQHSIPVVSESLFGVGHRQIIFNVSSGDVWANQVRPTRSTIEAKP
jgi:chemotaxis protein CheD